MPGMEIRAITPHDVDAVVRLWQASKRETYDFLPVERDRTLDDLDTFFRERILPRCAIWIAVDDGRVLGFFALTRSYLDRLFVHPDAQRRGVGTALFAKAKELSPAGIELHTHQKNLRACSFYEKLGLRAVHYGMSPAPENEPDVEYHWRP